MPEGFLQKNERDEENKFPGVKAIIDRFESEEKADKAWSRSSWITTKLQTVIEKFPQALPLLEELINPDLTLDELQGKTREWNTAQGEALAGGYDRVSIEVKPGREVRIKYFKNGCIQFTGNEHRE